MGARRGGAGCAGGGQARGACRSGRARAALAYLALAVAALAAMVASLCVGSTALSPTEVVGAIVAGYPDDPAASTLARQVIWQIRLPRALAAAILGAALALSGYLLQTFFDNPIAGPYVLGVSNGARLALALTMVFVAGGSAMTSAQQVGAAFIGSLAAMGLVMLFARRVRSRAMVIVAGVMVGYACNAETDFVVAFADDRDVANLSTWGLGSFSGTSWGDVGAMALIVAACSVAALCLAKPIGAYLMGEDYARSVGVDVGAFRAALVGVACMLAACVTAFAGPVSFVGIAVPFLAKAAVGTARPRRVMPACLLAGSAFCLVCDLVSRTAFSPVEVSLSAVTAVFGVPVVLAIMLRGHRVRGGAAAGEGEAAGEGAGREAAGGAPAGSPVPPAARGGGDEPPALEACDLSVGYRGRVVASGIGFAVRPGELVCLVGPNGAGKSTLLRTLGRTLGELGGTVRICGADARDMGHGEVARAMASLSTERLDAEMLTCLDVVEEGRYPHTGRMGTLAEADRKVVRESMELTRTWGLRGRDFLALSDGQRQRVLVARALCQQPRILLLDEPATFLDVRYKVELLELVRGLAHDRGIAVVASLHELDLAEKVADRVVCLGGDGRVAGVGAPQEVLTRRRVAEVFGMGQGCFDPLLGGVEMPPASGEPRAFVVAGGAAGAQAMRELRQRGVAFAAYVERPGDLDAVVARDLAALTVSRRPGEPDDALLARALEAMRGCEELLACAAQADDPVGVALVERARRDGMRVTARP